ncbi:MULTISPECIES: hypothetical protein [Microbacterium]|uniref:Uncharacterized protein n=1 Tax=Microbacterium hominis TaxID=162426 RepID=A0A2K9DHY8_9MICO|nr:MULTISPECIES: hypothetical protein [Microbacterium]AUG29097.1 hypothetical protein CXR34_06180 [Microbacterium hominis]QOC24966.1 hypothetical protein IC745_11375 [Microbacterium hominis]QOC29014.1 hypothetical protein IC744_00730 [Microbacterium hominis]QYF98775.1 hypothetical protein KY498_06020 [Microbacterium sp. PAMC21962]
MIDTLRSVVRELISGIGMLAPDVAQIGALSAVAVAVATLAVVVLVATAASTLEGASPTRVRSARSRLLAAPLAQSDPDAPGHVLRRGPSRAAPAA